MNPFELDGEFDLDDLCEILQSEITEAAAPAPPSAIEQTLITAEDLRSGHRPEPKEKVTEFLREQVSILDAYNMWIGKTVGRQTGDTVMVSCPHPTHLDSDPSASLTLAKDVGVCHGTCGNWGFDQIDLCAIGQGFDPQGYKLDPTQFGQVVEAMASAFGFETVEVGGLTALRMANGTLIGAPPDPAERISQTLKAVESGEVTLEEMLPATKDLGAPAPGIPVDTPHGRLYPEGSFLDEWVEACRSSDGVIPPEFFFGTGLIALGCVAGRDVSLVGFGKTTFGSINIVLNGPTGSGKSMAVDHLETAIDRVIPFDEDNPASSTGCRWIQSSATGEDLIGNFSRADLAAKNQVTPGMVPIEDGIRGVVYYDELEGLMRRAGRAGNTLQDVMMNMMTSPSQVGTSSRTSGRIVAESPHASVISTTQPAAVARYLGSHEISNGFINRFIVILGHARRMNLNSTQINIDSAVRELHGVHTWTQFGHDVSMDTDAKALFVDWYNDYVFPRMNSGEADGTLARSELTFKRLCLLTAINEKAKVVDLNMAQRVMFLMRSFLVPAMQDFGDAIEKDDDEELEDRILSALRRKMDVAMQTGDPEDAMMTEREIRKSSRVLKRNVKATNQTLQRLAQSGEIECSKSTRTERFALNVTSSVGA